MSNRALETKRDMVIDFLRKTNSARDVERAFELFVLPDLRHMLLGGTPGHDERGNVQDQAEADEFSGYVHRKYEG